MHLLLREGWPKVGRSLNDTETLIVLLQSWYDRPAFVVS